MIITVTLNPAIDKTASLKELKKNELNRVDSSNKSAAGKGINVSKTLKALRKESIALGFIAGEDGEYIKKSLDELKIKNDFVEVNGNTRTNLKIMDENNELTEINEAGPTITKVDVIKLFDSIKRNLKAKDILVLSGSAPKGVDNNIYARLIKLAHERDAKVLLDADGELFKKGVEMMPEIIKPNKHEICEYFKIGENISDDKLISYGKRFINSGCELVVISLGKKGAIFIDKDNVVLAEALDVKVSSSVGAGDAMVAALAFSAEEGLNDETMIKFSVAASAGAVMSEGTNPASLETVDKLMREVKIRCHV